MHGHEHADAPADADHTPDPATWWEQRYADSDGVWSGRVNDVLRETVPSLPVWSGNAPRALDLGCGEGADVIWLAEHGWEVTGVDLSPTAVERARRASVIEDVPERTTFVAADLATWAPEAGTTYDLVTASFLQSWPAEIPRAAILRRARDLVGPGGFLLVTAHGAPPHGAPPHGELPEEMRAYRFPTPEGDLEAIGLGAGAPAAPAGTGDAADAGTAADGGTAAGSDDGWTVVTAELRPRTATAPDGSTHETVDSVVLVRRS